MAQFAEATHLGIDNAVRLADEIESIRSTWAATVRARTGSTLRRLLDLLLTQPAINIRYAAEALDVSTESVRRVIGTLEDAGVITQAGGGQRYRRWVATDILDALDHFAERSW